eukprot:8406508-Alexandrium_andersonii.AAC.1
MVGLCVCSTFLAGVRWGGIAPTLARLRARKGATRQGIANGLKQGGMPQPATAPSMPEERLRQHKHS